MLISGKNWKTNFFGKISKFFGENTFFHIQNFHEPEIMAWNLMKFSGKNTLPANLTKCHKI